MLTVRSWATDPNNRPGKNSAGFTCRWLPHNLVVQMLVVHLDSQSLNSGCQVLKLVIIDDWTTYYQNCPLKTYRRKTCLAASWDSHGVWLVQHQSWLWRSWRTCDNMKHVIKGIYPVSGYDTFGRQYLNIEISQWYNKKDLNFWKKKSSFQENQKRKWELIKKCPQDFVVGVLFTGCALASK